jgi:hypothetical protein
MPNTSYRLTRRGRSSLRSYWDALDRIRERADLA